MRGQVWRWGGCLPPRSHPNCISLLLGADVMTGRADENGVEGIPPSADPEVRWPRYWIDGRGTVNSGNCKKVKPYWARYPCFQRGCASFAANRVVHAWLHVGIKQEPISEYFI
jgi:hypothetical protein